MPVGIVHCSVDGYHLAIAVKKRGAAFTARLLFWPVPIGYYQVATRLLVALLGGLLGGLVKKVAALPTYWPLIFV